MLESVLLIFDNHYQDSIVKIFVIKEKTQFSITIDTVTVYNAVESQCDSNPLETADGSIIDLNNHPKNWIAVSRDLLKKNGGNLEFGDTVILVARDKRMCGRFIVREFAKEILL